MRSNRAGLPQVAYQGSQIVQMEIQDCPKAAILSFNLQVLRKFDMHIFQTQV